MSKKLKNAIFILVLAATLVYLFFKGPRLQSFGHLTVFKILLLPAMSFLGYVVLGLVFRSLVQVFGVGLAF